MNRQRRLCKKGMSIRNKGNRDHSYWNWVRENFCGSDSENSENDFDFGGKFLLSPTDDMSKQSPNRLNSNSGGSNEQHQLISSCQAPLSDSCKKEEICDKSSSAAFSCCTTNLAGGEMPFWVECRDGIRELILEKNVLDDDERKGNFNLEVDAGLLTHDLKTEIKCEKLSENNYENTLTSSLDGSVKFCAPISFVTVNINSNTYLNNYCSINGSLRQIYNPVVVLSRVRMGSESDLSSDGTHNGVEHPVSESTLGVPVVKCEPENNCAGKIKRRPQKRRRCTELDMISSGVGLATVCAESEIELKSKLDRFSDHRNSIVNPADLFNSERHTRNSLCAALDQFLPASTANVPNHNSSKLLSSKAAKVDSTNVARVVDEPVDSVGCRIIQPGKRRSRRIQFAGRMTMDEVKKCREILDIVLNHPFAYEFRPRANCEHTLDCTCKKSSSSSSQITQTSTLSPTDSNPTNVRPASRACSCSHLLVSSSSRLSVTADTPGTSSNDPVLSSRSSKLPDSHNTTHVTSSQTNDTSIAVCAHGNGVPAASYFDDIIMRLRCHSYKKLRDFVSDMKHVFDTQELPTFYNQSKSFSPVTRQMVRSIFEVQLQDKFPDTDFSTSLQPASPQ